MTKCHKKNQKTIIETYWSCCYIPLINNLRNVPSTNFTKDDLKIRPEMAQTELKWPKLNQNSASYIVQNKFGLIIFKMLG